MAAPSNLADSSDWISFFLFVLVVFIIIYFIGIQVSVVAVKGMGR